MSCQMPPVSHTIYAQPMLSWHLSALLRVVTHISPYRDGRSALPHTSCPLTSFAMALCCAGLPQAQPLSALGVLLFVVFSGLTIRGEDMPSYWLWLYWVRHAFTLKRSRGRGEGGLQ